MTAEKVALDFNSVPCESNVTPELLKRDNDCVGCLLGSCHSIVQTLISDHKCLVYFPECQFNPYTARTKCHIEPNFPAIITIILDLILKSRSVTVPIRSWLVWYKLRKLMLSPKHTARFSDLPD